MNLTKTAVTIAINKYTASALNPFFASLKLKNFPLHPQFLQRKYLNIINLKNLSYELCVRLL